MLLANLIDKRNQKFEDAVDELLVSCAAQVRSIVVVLHLAHDSQSMRRTRIRYNYCLPPQKITYP